MSSASRQLVGVASRQRTLQDEERAEAAVAWPPPADWASFLVDASGRIHEAGRVGARPKGRETVNPDYRFSGPSSVSIPPLTPAHWRAGRPQSAMKPAAADSSNVLFGS